jgi:hypothetical protein
MKATLTLVLVLAAQTSCLAGVRAQSPSIVGRWQINLIFTNTARHTLRFDAQAAGKGSYLLLDARSSLVEPAKASDAEWTPTGVNTVDFSGPIEFPIGNVGRNAGTLVFKGTFETGDSISGDVAFFPIGQDPKDGASVPSQTGTFKATRVTAEGAPRVHLLSPDPGRRLRRGQEVEIGWQADSVIPISMQQLFLSLDNGETFAPITSILEGDKTSLAWTIPETLPKTKKAMLKILVVDVIGDSAEDTSQQAFRIK